MCHIFQVSNETKRWNLSVPCQKHNLAGVLQRKFIVSQIFSSEMMIVSSSGGSMLTECHRAMNQCQMTFVSMPPFFLWKLFNISKMRFAHFHQNYRALVSKTTRNSQKKSYNSIMTMKFSDIFTFSLFTISRNSLATMNHVVQRLPKLHIHLGYLLPLLLKATNQTSRTFDH